MKESRENTDRKLLRIVYPKLYDHLMEELSLFNIHPYDIRATSRPVGEDVEIQVCCGEGYGKEITRTFPAAAINSIGSEFTEFAKEVGETCKETMFADYLKMIKL